jgi:hypothetical protein
VKYFYENWWRREAERTDRMKRGKTMKKILLIGVFFILLAIALLTLAYKNTPFMRVMHDQIAEIDTVKFYCGKFREPYEVICETGNKDLDFQCFIIEPHKEIRASVIINRSVEGEMLIHVRDSQHRVRTFSLPDPGMEQRGGGASSGRVYYLEWDSEKNQTDMEYFSIIIRKIEVNEQSD